MHFTGTYKNKAVATGFCSNSITSVHDVSAMISSMLPTFLASLRAVGTASTMAFAGVYLHRRYVHVFFTFISSSREDNTLFTIFANSPFT